MSIPLWSCSFVQGRLIDILLPSRAVPLWLGSVLSHIKKAVCSGHSLHWRRAGGLHSCEGYGITGGTSTEQMSQMKKRERRAASQPREQGEAQQSAAGGRVGGRLCVTMASSALLTAVKARLATSHCRTTCPPGPLPV